MRVCTHDGVKWCVLDYIHGLLRLYIKRYYACYQHSVKISMSNKTSRSDSIAKVIWKAFNKGRHITKDHQWSICVSAYCITGWLMHNVWGLGIKAVISRCNKLKSDVPVPILRTNCYTLISVEMRYPDSTTGLIMFTLPFWSSTFCQDFIRNSS